MSVRPVLGNYLVQIGMKYVTTSTHKAVASQYLWPTYYVPTRKHTICNRPYLIGIIFHDTNLMCVLSSSIHQHCMCTTMLTSVLVGRVTGVGNAA